MLDFEQYTSAVGNSNDWAWTDSKGVSQQQWLRECWVLKQILFGNLITKIAPFSQEQIVGVHDILERMRPVNSQNNPFWARHRQIALETAVGYETDLSDFIDQAAEHALLRLDTFLES